MATNDRPDAESVSKFADESPGLRAFDPADDQRESNAARHSGLEVRSYRLLESHAIGQLPYRYELHHPESEGDRPGTTQLITRRLFAGENSSKPLFVAIDVQSRQLLGALQCQQGGSDERWTLRYLAAQEAASRSNPAPVALLEHAIGQAGCCGARRIMARSQIDSAVTGTLRATGFSAYAHEYVYALPAVPAGEINRSVRIQENSDVWGIHQLYIQTTPRDVQNAEALTSHEWDVDLEGRTRRGWLIVSEAGPIAYVRVRTSRKLHQLDSMFLPEARQVLAMLFGTVFAALGNESPRPLYVSVRGYQQELASILTSAGFELEADQLMMVRYTTSPVPARTTEGYELLRPAESSTGRVPSYFVRDVHE